MSSRASPLQADPARLPIVSSGMRIGLFGGSFDPAHEGHRVVSLLAWKRLGLDQIWWLVTPGNPLKDTRALPDLTTRVERARAVAHSPFIEVTGIEGKLGTRFTYDTVSRLRSRFPDVRFVLVIGADNLAEFHRWRRWRALASFVPIAAVDRAGWTLRSLASPAAHALAAFRVPERDAIMLASSHPPAWTFLHGVKSAQSSTALRISASSRPEG